MKMGRPLPQRSRTEDIRRNSQSLSDQVIQRGTPPLTETSFYVLSKVLRM